MILAQHRWTERNPGYFRGHYSYVKQWRARRKGTARPMIQDKITLLKPLYKMTANAYAPRLAAWEPWAGIPKGRSNPLVKGGVHAPPENASVRGGRRSLSRELTLLIQGGLGRGMIQDEILLQHIDRTTFMATGPGS